MDPLTHEAKVLERLFSSVNGPNEVRIKEIEQLYHLCWNVDRHCSKVSEFANEIMERIQKATAAIDSCLKEVSKQVEATAR
jgi:hypothetical protein